MVEHKCVKSFDDSSEGREVEATFKFYIEHLEAKNVGIRITVSDDESTMRAHLAHSHKEEIEAGMLTSSLAKTEIRCKENSHW